MISLVKIFELSMLRGSLHDVSGTEAAGHALKKGAQAAGEVAGDALDKGTRVVGDFGKKAEEFAGDHPAVALGATALGAGYLLARRKMNRQV
jgi:hypothetical protein